jgi:hypothetical protein
LTIAASLSISCLEREGGAVLSGSGAGLTPVVAEAALFHELFAHS